MTQSIQKAIAEAGIGDRLVMPGYVARPELPLWYSGADLFVYPSTYEGFGYPVLEAMSAGTPVISSNTSSLPEIAGDAGLLVPPREEKQLAAAMASILTDGSLTANLREQGLKQADKFSWTESVRTCLNLYESLGSRVHSEVKQ